MTPNEFTAIIRIVQRHHLAYAVRDGKWNIQTADGDPIGIWTWQEVLEFADKAKDVPTDSQAIEAFNKPYRDAFFEANDLHKPARSRDCA